MVAKEKKRAIRSLAVGIVAALAFPRPALAQSSPTATSKPGHSMVFVGDSIMDGSGAGKSPSSIVNRLGALRPSWTILNHSAGGASVSGGPMSQPMDPHPIVPLHGDPIVVFLGTNDWGLGIPIAKFETSYHNFIHVLDDLHPQVICVTPIWRTGEGTLNSAGYKLDDYRKAITQICTADGHPVIDGLSLVPDDPKYYLDGIHPNDAGDDYYARHLAEALDRLVSP